MAAAGGSGTTAAAGDRGPLAAPAARTRLATASPRAIAIAVGMPYREVHEKLTAAKVPYFYEGGDRDLPEWSKRVKRRGGVRAFDADHGCWDEVYAPYLEELGWTYVSTKEKKVRLRADELPKGKLIVSIRRHLVAVIDHVIHDTCGGNGRVTVRGYWTAPPSRERASPDVEWLSKAARATALWKKGGRRPKDRFGRRPVTRAMLNAIRDATGAWSRRKAAHSAGGRSR